MGTKRRGSDGEEDTAGSLSSDERQRRKKEKKRLKKEKKKRRSEKKRQKRATSQIDRTDDAPAKAEPDSLAPEDALEVHEFQAEVQPRADESDGEYGPTPLPNAEALTRQQNVDYGGALRPGEGAAIAQYVQKNMRIPRRGEVGWQGDEIERLEAVGYVMSGSRHSRMNAVRIRKENQIYSAEEKRALALITFEEKQQRENKIMSEFRDMLQQRLKSEDTPRDAAEAS